MPIYESGEDYLETILLLHRKTGFVRSVDIAAAAQLLKAKHQPCYEYPQGRWLHHR